VNLRGKTIETMRVNDTIVSVFTTFSLSTGGAKNADVLPVATLRRNGIALAGVVVVVTNIGTGRYKASVVLATADGWIIGDCYALEVVYAMETVADIPLIIAQGPIIAAAAEKADYTQARAAKIDALDVAVSSRLATSAYIAPDNATIGITSAGVVSLLTLLTAARALKLDNLDAAISTRLAGAAYTAPDNAGITAGNSKLDTLLARLSIARANALDLLDVAISSRSSHSASDVWAVSARTLTSLGSLAADLANSVWLVAISQLTVDGSIGKWLIDTISRVRTKTDLIIAGQVVVSGSVTIKGNRITIHRGTTVIITLDGLGSLESRNAIYFTVKTNERHDDSQSIFQVKESAGLTYLNAVDVVSRSDEGSLEIVDEVTGSVKIKLEAAASSELNLHQGIFYDLKVITPSEVEVKVTGLLDVMADITRAIV
jgi:hypothetical protein